MKQYFSAINRQEIGIFSAIFSAIVWGFLPVYWKALQPINSICIMLYRMLFTGLFVLFVDLIVFGMKGIIEPLKKKGTFKISILAGLLISFNWYLFIWAVNSGQVIQTSIGYYIQPLIICAFGVLFFKEKLEKYKVIAISLAFCGVIIMLFSFGQVPVLALVIAITFALYTTLKKKQQIPALLSLLYETIFLAPIALATIIFFERKGVGAIGMASPKQLFLLIFIGLFTTIPLVLYAIAANRISLAALGITGYISPSMTLLLGTIVYKEAFDLFKFLGFVTIWIALIVFTSGGIHYSKQNKITTNNEERRSI